jgi:hypothetical protein
MRIEIPDIPTDLNPNGWEVEISFIGERKEGLWPLFYNPEQKKWVGNYCPMWDSTKEIRVRLIEPRHMFSGEMKTESECKEILDRDYEVNDSPFGYTRCDECPFWIRNTKYPDVFCGAENKKLYCGKDKKWMKKQSTKPTHVPANLPDLHWAYPVVMNEVKGLCVKFDKPFDLFPVNQCHNGMFHESRYLYGWCRKDAMLYYPDPISQEYVARWVLFRPLNEVKK